MNIVYIEKTIWIGEVDFLVVFSSSYWKDIIFVVTKDHS